MLLICTNGKLSGVTRVGVTRAATDGFTPIFFLKKLMTFFSHHRPSVLQCHLFFLNKLTIFLHATFFDFIQVSLTSCWVSPQTFLPVRPRLSTVLCTFSHIFFSFGCHPLEGVTWGVPPLPAP